MLLYRAFLFFEVEIALYKVYFYQYSILSSFSIHSSKALIASSKERTIIGSTRILPDSIWDTHGSLTASTSILRTD